MISEIREWLMLILEAGILYYVRKEFFYDAAKDEKKAQRKTRTTKKTTSANGQSVVEETEVVDYQTKEEEIK